MAAISTSSFFVLTITPNWANTQSRNMDNGCGQILPQGKGLYNSLEIRIDSVNQILKNKEKVK